MNAQTANTERPKSSWINLVVDFGPLLVFFLAYRHFSPGGDGNSLAAVGAVINATLAFMGATIVALMISKWRLGHISPMLWLTSALIFGFGALTYYSRNETWIMMKPTAVYLVLAAILFVGLWRGKPMLKVLLQSAFEGLSDEGWMKLSRNWAWFFVLLAVINTALVFTVSFGTWMQAKVWGFTLLSFAFTFAQLPMVLKHGMSEHAKEELAENPPHD